MANLFALLLVLVAGWIWLDTLRAREMALGLVRRVCDREGVQLLDQAVALRRMGVRWTAAGVRLRRVYRFEFSEEGTARRAGSLTLVGLRLEALELDRSEPGAP
ncbi:MAG: DUF3301 domain-containing protein [Thiohalocapsa sp.]|nr:DUF3301 domain-containing protein [Thiohalocapsa sp.]